MTPSSTDGGDSVTNGESNESAANPSAEATDTGSGKATAGNGGKHNDRKGHRARAGGEWHGDARGNGGR